jgi:hypothetical protein
MAEQPTPSLYMSELTLTVDSLRQALADFDQAQAEHDETQTVEGIHAFPFIQEIRGNFETLNNFLGEHYQESEITDVDLISARNRAEDQIVSLQQDIEVLRRTSVLRG